MNGRRLFLLCSCFLILAGAAWVSFNSSGRQGRSLTSREALTPYVNSLTLVRYDGTLEHSIFDADVYQFEASVDTGIVDAGDLAVIDATMLSTVVSGRTGNLGQLMLVARQGATLSVTPLHTETGADFGGVAHSATLNRLYVFDAVVGRILWVPYTAGQTSLGPWSLLTDASSTPELGLPGVCLTSLMHVEDGPSPALVLTPQNWWSDIPTVRVQVTTTGPVATIENAPPSEPILKISSHMVPNSTSVEVTGYAGELVEIVRADAQPPTIIGSGVIDTSGTATITTSPLLWGRIYAARSPGGDSQPPFDSPSVLSGTPDMTPIGQMRSLRFQFPAHCAFLGHDHFQIPVRIDVDTASVTPPATYSAVMNVGVLGISNIIPIPTLENPGRVLLSGLADYSTNVLYDDVGIPPIGSVKFPLPNDDSLAGAVLLFQWLIVFSPTDVRVSDVIGYMVRDTPWVPPSSEWLLAPLGTPPNFLSTLPLRSTQISGLSTTAVQMRPRPDCLRSLFACFKSNGFVTLTRAAAGKRLRLLRSAK